MSRDHINHSDLVRFAQDRVNLPKDKANVYRAQVRRLREKLESYVSDHPDFTLKKIMLSGSLAKGTALRTLNDIDVACYISGAEAPSEISELLSYLAEKLRSAFPNFSPEQVSPQTYSVTVSFRGTGLDVDVVPILYFDDPQWKGELVSQDDGSFLETSIPMHLEFIKKRKDANEAHFSQVIRLIKFWAKNLKIQDPDFRFKSFMIELILAHLSDQGTDFSDYPEALQNFFTFIATSGLIKQISFSDFYPKNKVPVYSDPVRIIDPVNFDNNTAKLYTIGNRDSIIEAALEAGDAIDAALAAPTKQETVYYWSKVFGPSFNP